MVCHFVIKIALLRAMFRGDGGGRLIARQESTFVTIRGSGFQKETSQTKAMLAQKQAEEAIVSNLAVERENESKEEEKHEDHSVFSVKNILWHGGSTWDARFSCASNQMCMCVSYTQIHSYTRTFVNTHFIPSTPFDC
ncbi:uncharacterized protein LOC130783084 [Actinidia eriantha]|uniref:uncharacterized protein LOC130783084 n=1 Tax=Actinidia eriantha TaxID=165200 RepID=UPI0025892295|nr:uncharacterized protein LOC130783084 [Actinidia eriantha]